MSNPPDRTGLANPAFPAPEDRRCIHIKKNGDRCGRYAMPGATRCSAPYHGLPPRGRQAARRRVIEAQAAMVLARRSSVPTPIEHPVQELLDLCAEARAFKEVLTERVADLLANDDLVLIDTAGAEQVRAIVTVYERAIDRTQKFLADVVRLDLEGRLVRIREAELAKVIGAIERGLASAGLSVQDQEAAKVAIARRLRD